MPTFHSRSEEDTQGIARDLAGRLTPGAVVLLYGELGAGKTAFVRGLAEGLGADPAEVSSPTFTLIQEYRGRVPVYHVDLYRLERVEVDDLGLEELEAGDGVVAIEWADRLPRPVDGAVSVTIVEEMDGEGRLVTVSGGAAITPSGSSALPS
jgi:tRNA threonylcarbamoyladenosine biosynthesis protein TsaE